jgi:hypothetical protein
VAGGFATVALVWLAARSVPSTVNGATVLRYPRLFLLIWIPLTACFAAFTIFNAMGGNRVNSYPVAVLVPLILTCAGGFLIAETIAVAVTFDTHLVRAVSPWRKTREVPWTDLVHASSSPFLGWYVLRVRNAGTIRISFMLKGSARVPELLAMHGVKVDP